MPACACCEPGDWEGVGRVQGGIARSRHLAALLGNLVGLVCVIPATPLVKILPCLGSAAAEKDCGVLHGTTPDWPACACGAFLLALIGGDPFPSFLFLAPHRADKARGGFGGGGGLGGLGGGGFGGRDIDYLFSLSCKVFTASSRSWMRNCSPFTAPLICRITTACSSGFMSCQRLSSSATFVSPQPVDGRRTSCAPLASASPPLHSITSSARASRVAGTSRSSALAVARLTTSSYLVGSWIGRSPGFSPLRTRPA